MAHFQVARGRFFSSLHEAQEVGCEALQKKSPLFAPLTMAFFPECPFKQA